MFVSGDARAILVVCYALVFECLESQFLENGACHSTFAWVRDQGIDEFGKPFM